MYDQVRVEDHQAGGLEEEDQLDPDQVRLGQVRQHPPVSYSQARSSHEEEQMKKYEMLTSLVW